jgi:taurine dioxygenase
LNLTPLTGSLGATVGDINLSDALDETDAAAIRDAFSIHHVLVFPDQDLSADAQIRVTQAFGPAQAHPLSTRRTIDGHPEVLILENRPGLRGAPNDYWHSDISHASSPPLASLLHARTIPHGRGDTMFANMCKAYDDLSPGLRETLTGMRAMHSGEATRARSRAEKSDALEIGNIPDPSSHPMVRTLAEKDRRAIFVNPHFTTNIENMSIEESAPLLNFLYAHGTKPENIYRHRWSVGDLVVWDNRAVMHYAVRDYDEDMERLMYRTTAGGDVPV